MATVKNITSNFVRVYTLLDLMEQDVKAHNNTDFEIIDALLTAVRGEINSLYELVEIEPEAGLPKFKQATIQSNTAA